MRALSDFNCLCWRLLNFYNFILFCHYFFFIFLLFFYWIWQNLLVVLYTVIHNSVQCLVFSVFFHLKCHSLRKKIVRNICFEIHSTFLVFKKKSIFQISGKIRFRKLIFSNTQPFLVWQKNIWISNLYFQQILLPPNLVLICFKSLFPASKIFFFFASTSVQVSN